MGIQICSNKGGWRLLEPNNGQHKENFDKFSKIFSCTTDRNALIFGMGHPWGKGIQICSNEVPGVINRHALRGNSVIYAYKANTCKNLLLMNYMANFIQTWWGTCLRDGDSDLFI